MRLDIDYYLFANHLTHGLPTIKKNTVNRLFDYMVVGTAVSVIICFHRHNIPF